jgi:hypothetical protein
VSITRHFEDVKRIQAALKPGAPAAFRVLRQAPGATGVERHRVARGVLGRDVAGEISMGSHAAA